MIPFTTINEIAEPSAPIVGKRLILRELLPDDITDRYISWMNDPDITDYLETRTQSHTRRMLLDYVREKREDKNSALLGIILNQNFNHIGNIKLGPVNRQHSFASIGVLIGEKEYFGSGYATEAIGLVVDYTFKHLHIHKLIAGCYENNIGSIKAFEKNGFAIEGVRKEHVMFRGGYIDVVELGLINPYERTNE